MDWLKRESKLSTCAAIACGVARTTAAARPNRMWVTSSSFVSEYVTVAEFVSCFAPAELASNAANMPAPLASNSASDVLYTRPEAESIAAIRSSRCFASCSASASQTETFSASTLGSNNTRAAFSSVRRWFTWTRRFKALSLKPSSSNETRSDATTWAKRYHVRVQRRP